MPASFVILVPVKSPGVGKSRLTVLGDDLRRRLALAFARDTIEVACRTPRVLGVVISTGDAEVAASARVAGCQVVPDPGELNGALRRAARHAAARWPDAVPVALCGDLPCLTAADLSTALTAIPPDRAAFVADAHGTGTTMYAAPYTSFDPAFGSGSAAAHRAAGGHEVREDLSTLRLDVDDPADLSRARELGVGAHTGAALGLS